MKNLTITSLVLIALIFTSCGNSAKKATQVKKKAPLGKYYHSQNHPQRVWQERPLAEFKNINGVLPRTIFLKMLPTSYFYER